MLYLSLDHPLHPLQVVCPYYLLGMPRYDYACLLEPIQRLSLNNLLIPRAELDPYVSGVELSFIEPNTKLGDLS